MTAEYRDRNNPTDIPSPSYIYHSIRKRNNCQSGATLPGAFSRLKKGSYSLEQIPYSDSCKLLKMPKKPRPTGFRILGWTAVNPKRIDDVKGQIANGHPIIFGMSVGKKFILQKAGGTYAETERREGMHAMTAVGYDDKRQAVKVINSWGTRWGDGGFVWISYDVFKKQVLESYVIRVPTIPQPRPQVPESSSVEIAPEHLNPMVRPKPGPAKKVLSPVARTDAPDKTPPPTSEKTVADIPSDPPTQGPKPIKKGEVAGPPPLADPISDGKCSRIVKRQDGGRIEISGFVATQIELDSIQSQNKGQNVELDLRPWPQCELLLTLDNRLGAKGSPTVSIIDDTENFQEGDTLAIEVKTRVRPAYIYISYVQADGTVVHLHQPRGTVQSATKPATKFLFGDGRQGRTHFIVSEPFGREMIVVLAAASPLFPEPLPTRQIERDYLSALRKALIYKSDPAMPDREVAAAYLGIVTKGDDR